MVDFFSSLKDSTSRDPSSANEREIRAIYDETEIIVYQAFNDEIADWALNNGRFGGPYKFSRMTWIKPSFFWMMHRSGWATKPGQQRILAISIKRTFFDSLVNRGILTSNYNDDDIKWKESFANNDTRIQWDPERDVAGIKLKNVRAIQIGVSGASLIKMHEQAICSIQDITQYAIDTRSRLLDTEIGVTLMPNERLYSIFC